MLHCLVKDLGFELWSNAPAQLAASPSGRIQVVGRLFSRADAPGRIRSLEPAFDRAKDAPGALCARYWGAYVAFCRSTLGSIQIFRDPSGALPCYFQVTDEAILLFSDTDLAAAIGLSVSDIDMTEVVRLLAWPGLRPKRTALRGVEEIPQGWLLAIGGAQYHELRQLWSPWSFVEPTGLGFVEAAERLRCTAMGVIRVLAAEFERAHLSLSGGLDSSIVAAGLAGMGAICLNLLADGVEGDERCEAKLVADHFGLELADRRYRMGHADIGVSSAAHLPRPVGSTGRLTFDRAGLDFAQACGSQALFTGFGGDNVFCLTQSATPIADRLRATRSPLGAWRTTLDVCRLTGCSVGTAMRRAMPKLSRRAGRYAWSRQPRFLTPQALDLVPQAPAHPWLDAPPGALAGRAAHIAMIMRTHNFAEGFARSAPLEMINPLLSQPLVELCLSIPSWAWIQGGRDRSLARAAFTGILPAATIKRRAKGGPGAFYRQIVALHAKEIEQRLASGILAREGLLDPLAMHAFFDTPFDAAGLPYGRILDLCDAEAWLAQRGSV